MYSYTDYWRAYHAANKVLFATADSGELVKVAEAFATLVAKASEVNFGFTNDKIRYKALVVAVSECCNDAIVALVINEGERALATENAHERATRVPVDRDKKRRGTKPQAWQDHCDESFIHWSHKCSKSWKDQSKRKYQWK